MPYGTIKIDTITFTDGDVDKSVPVSGLVQNPTFTGNITATGTISGNIIQGGTTVSGLTVTGTTANFASGVFTTQVSGVTVIATTGTFTSLTGTTTNGTTASFTTGNFTSLTGTTTTGTTANFASGVFTTQVSGVTVIATTGTFTSLTGTTTTMTSGVFASGTEPLPSISFVSDPNTGIYSPGADQLAVATNGVGRVVVNNIGLGVGIAPNRSIDVYRGDAGQAILRLSDVDSRNVELRSPDGTGNTAGVGTVTNHDFIGFTGNTERLRITSTGALNFVGAGTAGSTQAVSFNGSAPVNSMVLDSSGRLGIGTSDPRGIIHVGADLHSGATDAAAINLKQTSTTAATGIYLERSTERKGYYIYLGGNEDSLNFQRNNNGTKADVMTLTRDGLVGIGTTGPDSALHIVSTSAGADPNHLILANVSASAGTTASLYFAPNLTGRTRAAAIKGINMAGGGGGNPTDLAFFTNADGGSPTEKVRIDTSGRLLVGTSISPTVGIPASALFVVQGYPAVPTGDSLISLQRGQAPASITSGAQLGGISFGANDGSPYAQIHAATDGAGAVNDYPGRLVFSTTADGASSPTPRMTIDSAGRLLVSTSSTSHGGGGGIQCSSVNATSHALIVNQIEPTAGTTYKLISGYRGVFGVSAAETFIVYNNGDVQNVNNSYGAISDIKLKENIVDATSQWSDIKALQVRKYNFKEGQTHTQIGLVAQEVELVSPGLVNESPDRDEDGNDLGTVTKSVNYSVLYMKAVKALQEAMERIETLEVRLTAAGIE